MGPQLSMRTNRKTDLTERVAAFRNSTNAPNKNTVRYVKKWTTIYRNKNKEVCNFFTLCHYALIRNSFISV